MKEEVTDINQAINKAQVLKQKELVLSGLELENLPEKIKDLKEHLTVLDLSNNKFQRIPPEINALVNLEQLILKRNKIRYLQFDFSQLSKLKIISLKGNMLEKFPRQILNLTNLQELSIAHNFITEIPDDIKKLTNLRVFFADSNKITKLPAELAELKELVAFTIFETPVGYNIKGGMCHFIGIDRVKKYLNKDNSIVEIHANFKDLKLIIDNILLEDKLDVINLSINEKIDDLVSNLYKLLSIYSTLFNKNYEVIGMSRNLFVMYYIGIKKVKTISKILGISKNYVGTIRARLKIQLNKSNNKITEPEELILNIKKEIEKHFML